jgi:hypothetical protein
MDVLAVWDLRVVQLFFAKAGSDADEGSHGGEHYDGKSDSVTHDFSNLAPCAEAESYRQARGPPDGSILHVVPFSSRVPAPRALLFVPGAVPPS